MTTHDDKVTAVIPVHQPNLVNGMLGQAMASVAQQTRPVDALAIAVDTTHAGAAETRNRALATVRTQWTAFLDSDDLWYPHHLEALLDTAHSTGADLVYPWFDVPAGFDPFPQYEGQPFNPQVLRDIQNYIPITTLVRTELLHRAGGFRHRGNPANPCEDWGMWLNLLDRGAKIVHHNGRTWEWRWHAGNTSGSGEKW